MANEFRHKDVGANLSQTEWEAIGSHIFNSQATGDIVYASSSTQLTRLGIGSADDLLTIVSGIPAWRGAETLPVLLKGGNLLHIPTNVGWTEVVAGTGATSQVLSRATLTTGTNASSSARLYAPLFGFRIGTEYFKFDWDKKLYVIFNYVRSASDSEVIGRYQVKETNAEGALGAKGIGIRVNNFNLWGESYGTGLGVIDLSTTLADNAGYQIVIIHYPGSKIEWYVNGILKGTQSTSGNIPSGLGTTSSKLVYSLVNGGTGGVNADSQLLHPKIWQEL